MNPAPPTAVDGHGLSRRPERGPLDIRVWSPFLKQAPTAAMFIVAILMALNVAALKESNDVALIGSLVIMAAATGLALALNSRISVHRFEVVVVAADFVAIALFRYASGGSTSIFTSLLFLPLVWMASLPKRIYVVWSALGGALVIFLPIPIDYLIGGAIPTIPDLQRSLFGLSVYLIAAGVINEISRQARVNLHQSQVRERAASDELQRAAAVQRALLPKDQQILPGYQLAGMCVPSRSVGGDFFDWYTIAGGIAITMGDVMGKGVGAGMVAATARAVVRGAASEPDPRIALERVAECLTNELRDASTFLTLFHARLDADTGVLEYADAGHGLSLLVRADGTYERMQSPDLPVGILPDAQWTRQSIDLAPGDTLVSFSDGVLDLYDGSLSAIEEIATITRNASTAHAMSEVLAALARKRRNDDDVTIVALRRDSVNADPALLSA